MGKIVGIFGESGVGKTTSTIINPDGSVDLSEKGYKGMDPKSHFILNLDMKAMPIPGKQWHESNKNYATTSDFNQIRNTLKWIAKQDHLKCVAIDTLNVYLAIKELNDRKMKTFDTWRDIANDIIELNNMCNTILREDQIAYIFGHTTLETNNNTGEDIERMSVVGKKLKKNPPESFYPIVLIARIEWGEDGDNDYYFETKANHSTAKTPIGMFSDFKIPNSLKLVDEKVREYYQM